MTTTDGWLARMETVEHKPLKQEWRAPKPRLRWRHSEVWGGWLVRPYGEECFGRREHLITEIMAESIREESLCSI